MNGPLFLILTAIFGATSTHSSAISLISDGAAVVEPGIFTRGCIYGDNASISDHAPVIYKEQKMATWNVSNRVSHLPIHKKWGTFLGHKFKTDQHYTLIDDQGRPAIAGFQSEVADVSLGKEVVNEFFGLRLRNVAKKIKEMFHKHDIENFVIQEIPNRLKTDVDGKNFHEMITEILAPELTVHFPQRPPNWKDWPPDVALVTKAGAKVKMKLVDATNRLQPYCLQDHDTCIVAAHFSFPKSESELIDHCNVMQRLVQKLHKDVANVVFLGDFNTSAEDIARACSGMGVDPIVHRADGSPQSCRDNDGTHSDHHIDLLIHFPRAGEKSSILSESVRSSVEKMPIEEERSSAQVSTASPDGNRTLTISGNNIIVSNDSERSERTMLVGHRDMVRSAAFSPNGEQIVSASSDGTAALWSTLDGQRLRSFPLDILSGMNAGRFLSLRS